MQPPQKPKKNAIKFFDVVGPGKSSPSRTSKPIINSDKADPPDPMMASTKQPHPPQQTPARPISPQQTASPLESSVVASIHQPKNRLFRFRIMLILVGGILVLFIIADLLVDARVVHTSLTPLTHFFHHPN